MLYEFITTGLGCPVEMEFALNLPPSDGNMRAQLAVLQLRPMSAREQLLDINITDSDRDQAFCLSHQALGSYNFV